MTLSMVSALPILLAGLLCGLGAQAGVANTWDSLSIVEATPSPRIFPTMCPFTLRITQFYSTDLMFVFGGWDSASDVTYNDSSFYVVETSSFFIQVFTGTGPSSRLGSSSAQVSPAIALVFGGATNKAMAFNDTFMYSCAGISPAGNCTVSQVEYAAGPVPDGRAFQTSVAINGMFYLFGGNLNVFDYRRVLNDCWKFDPSTRLWTEIPTPSVIEPRELHSSTTTGDYMFIYGGVGTATYDTEFVMEVLDDLWALNTVTLVWQRLQPSSAVQPGTYSASMGGLKALPPSADNITHCQFVLSGGLTSGITVDLPTTTYTVNLSMSQPDPAQLSVAPNNVSYLDTHTAGKWRLVTTISAPSSRSGAAYAVSNNIMYVFGGGLTFSSGELSNDMYALNMTEAVNDDESLWIHLNSDHIYDKPVGRMYAASHYSPVTNRIYVLQGSEVYFASNAPLDDGWFLDLNTQSWSRAESMPISARYAHTATYSSVTGLSYVYGGCYGNLTDCFTMYSDVYSFDEHTLEFTTVSVPANQLHPIQRYFHVSVMLHGTQMVVFGGLQNATYEEWKNVWVLDVISLEWSVRRPRPGQLWPASSLIPVATEVDNRMYLSGGLGGDSFDIMWIFDVMTNDWERLVTVTAADVAGRSRWGLASATLGTKILAYGGSATNQSFLADADGFFSNTFLQYDTVSNAWVTIDTDGQSEYLRGGTGYNILNGTFAMYGGATPYYATSTVLMLTPGCTIGSYSSNYRIYPCTDCEAGYYSAVSGATECTKCPGQSYTSQTGATDVSACNECQSDVCNGNGVCSLRGNVGRCSCQFGYLASDNCHLPWIVIIIVSGVVSTIVTIVILFRIRRLRRRVKRADEDKSMFEHLLGQKEAEFSDLEKTWVIPERDIERFRCVASGAFGDVYEGEYGDRPVAIKYLKIAVMESDPASLAEFEREVSFMRTLRNPNIVFFYGAGRTEEGSPFIVTEFMPMGALSDILSDENVALDDTRRRQFALDGAKGMCFLHELSPPRIHRDLKPGNLLVSAKWTVKVADFGTFRLVFPLGRKKKSGEQRKEVFMENIAGTLAGVGRKMAQTVRFKVVRHDSVGGGGVVTPDGASVPADVLMSDFPTNSSGYVSIGAGGGGSGSGSATSSREGSRKGVLKQQPLSEEERRKRSLTKGVGSLLWQSPEILQGREDYDLKTDVYSYGIVLWQIVTRQVPYTDVEFHWELESRVIEGLRPPLPQATEYGSQYARLMEACWHGDPGCRPSFAQIVDTLENM